LKLLGRANGLIQLINRRALIVNRKLGVANDVDEQDMGDLELDLFLDLGGHFGAPRGYANEMISTQLPTVESKARMHQVIRSPGNPNKLSCSFGITKQTSNAQFRPSALNVGRFHPK